ncbi:MAG TPA: cation transporter, partial [Prolixibacteraceae bacterium]|nr:cation transporter [Prolixibacteraceae bacterium]
MASGSLKKFIYLSIFAAVMTITLKGMAFLLTGSVGLLSDALESGVNLVAALVALVILSIAEKPADDDHAFGHSKAEYFSSAIEG